VHRFFYWLAMACGAVRAAGMNPVNKSKTSKSIVAQQTIQASIVLHRPSQDHAPNQPPWSCQLNSPATEILDESGLDCDRSFVAEDIPCGVAQCFP
jgi:hypothetical protein